MVINLKEGIIELQGPVDFVRYYLDTYQAAIKALQDLPENIAVSSEKARALTWKRIGSRRRSSHRFNEGGV